MDEESLQEQFDAISEVNAQIIARLGAHGISMNMRELLTQKHERFISFLVKEGVITRAQLLRFDIEWQTAMNEDLMKAEVEVRQKLQAGPRLIVPGSMSIRPPRGGRTGG